MCYLKQNMKIFFCLLISAIYEFRISCGQQNFLYEKMNRYGLGRRIIEDYRRAKGDKSYIAVDNEHPKTLPPPSLQPYIKSPWQNLYQGVKGTDDVKVLDRKFEYPAKALGHQIGIAALFNCAITHLSVETSGGIPMIIRGGAGNKNLGLIVKAKPTQAIKGRATAFCKPSKDENFPVGLLGPLPNYRIY